MKQLVLSYIQLASSYALLIAAALLCYHQYNALQDDIVKLDKSKSEFIKDFCPDAKPKITDIDQCSAYYRKENQ